MAGSCSGGRGTGACVCSVSPGSPGSGGASNTRGRETAGGAVGMGVWAAAWLMFLDFMPNGARTQQGPGLWTSYAWTVPLDGFLGMVLPNVVADWWVYGILKPHVSAE